MFRNIFTFLIFCFISFETNAGSTDWFDFVLDGGAVKIPVVVDGHESFGILDTGAQINGINHAFLEKNALSLDRDRRVEIAGIFDTEKRDTYKNVPVELFGIPMELDRIVDLDFADEDSALLIGAGFFSQFVVQIDYPKRKMRLLTRDSVNLKKVKNLEAKKIPGSGGVIVKVGMSDDRSAWLTLDTGNTMGVVVQRKLADRLGWLDEVKTGKLLASGVTGQQEVDIFRVPEIQFGPFTMENVLVTIPEDGEGSNLESQHQYFMSRFKSEKVEGLIGYDVLKHFLLTIDYKYAYAHISPSQE